MKRKLFLTGPIGCGKSTAILTAIGEKLPAFGGFLTKRFRDEDGQAIAFSLESPNGKQKAEFLDCRGLVPAIHMDVFETMAPELLKGKYLILDEIGGLELLCPAFTAALDTLLERHIPIIGVVKGEGPASAMIRKLGLSEEYQVAANRFREKLRNDPETLVYDCGKFDQEALQLAREWVKEYAREELF